ncbi:hypothetical protein Q9966_016692 [Columba livia]|nr:hypothetical protein Q9966_016692 [Columba livia]
MAAALAAGPGAGAGAAPLLRITAECGRSRARAGELLLPHGPVPCPVFMPVGTRGTAKGVTAAQLAALGCRICLGNTFHLGTRPGPELMRRAGGLHRFMDWPHNLLTDSGGFQMVSLAALAEVTEEGVHFCPPHGGPPLLLTPEKSIDIQKALGADIMMQLDDVVSSTTGGPRVQEAMERSVRWLDRCLAAHPPPQRQLLFAIVQGGLDPALRTRCLQAMTARPRPRFRHWGPERGGGKGPILAHGEAQHRPAAPRQAALPHGGGLRHRPGRLRRVGLRHVRLRLPHPHRPFRLRSRPLGVPTAQEPTIRPRFPPHR